MRKDTTPDALNELHKQAKSARARYEPLSETAWLAGFTDGEGSFNICQAYKETLIPRFKISLRADDLAILEELQAEFGGRVCVVSNRTENQHAAVQWQVAKKTDLARLIGYFDRFPLRAKKAADYRIWRRAVCAYCARGSNAHELPALQTALIEGRRFNAPESADEIALDEPPTLFVPEEWNA